LRKSWKEVGLGILNLLAIILVIVVVQPVLRKHLANAVGGTLLALLVLATYVAGSKWLERRTPSELDARRLLPEVAFGFVIGFVLFTTSIAILWVAGVYHPVRGGTTNGLGGGMVAALIAGIFEEIVFRGLLFRLCSKILGTWGALLFSAALFGAAHSFNRGATVSSSLAIAIEAGVLLGAAYAATQRLWVPIGLHIGWNFTEGSIFGMSVSGNNVHAGLIQGSLSGPRILTGGQFGPEASIVAVIVALVAALYFIRRVAKQHGAEPPSWTVSSSRHSGMRSAIARKSLSGH
jgi:membrane protease YdiL (CAAX protease family)